MRKKKAQIRQQSGTDNVQLSDIYIFVYCRLSNATKQENVGK